MGVWLAFESGPPETCVGAAVAGRDLRCTRIMQGHAPIAPRLRRDLRASLFRNLGSLLLFLRQRATCCNLNMILIFLFSKEYFLKKIGPTVTNKSVESI